MTDDPVLASAIQPKAVNWLWRERFARGTISVVAGRPDQGKGLLAALVAADVTKRGGRVLYSAAEDAADLMTRPRLEAAGANLDNIDIWRFLLPTQQDELSAFIVERDYDLVVIDPFAAHLRGVSRFSDDIRTVLSPLSKLVEQTGTAVLIIEHALKRVAANSHPLTVIGGSGSGLPAAARMAYLLGVDPEDGDKRILACVKNNLRDKPKALRFEVDVDEFPVVGEIPSLVTEGEVEFNASRLVSSAEPGKVGRKPDKRAAAAEWLTKYLAEKGKPTKAGDVIEDAKQFGLANKTVRRAADDMGVVKAPPGGGRNCTWDLPADVKKVLGVAAASVEESKPAETTPIEPTLNVVGPDGVAKAEPTPAPNIDNEFAALLGEEPPTDQPPADQPTTDDGKGVE